VVQTFIGGDDDQRLTVPISSVLPAMARATATANRSSIRSPAVAAPFGDGVHVELPMTVRPVPLWTGRAGFSQIMSECGDKGAFRVPHSKSRGVVRTVTLRSKENPP
jgi:hypothetical protein